MKNRLLLTSIAALAIACVWAADPKLPPPFDTPHVTNRPRIVGQPAGADLKVPPGFTVELFDEGFDRARYMQLGPSNEILLSDSGRGGPNDPPNGTVYILKPTKKKLIENVYRPYGLAFWKGYLYVGEPTSIKRYKYDAKAMTVGPAEEVVSSMKDLRQGGHWVRNILFDRKGEKMYVGIGSASNVDAGEPPLRATINRWNPDGTGHEFYATGTRNPTALGWYPGTDTLWAAVQERDALGDDLVPDYFTSIKQGGFYGWPYAYIGPNIDPRRTKTPVTEGAAWAKIDKSKLESERPDLVAKTIVPDVLLGAHVAVLDFRFYTGRMFPAEYRGGAFLALHGSWNRSKRVGQSVAFLPFKNGKPAGPMREFLTGWLISPDSTDVWGRPVGLLQLPDGSLLVSEDGNNKIYRISYKGK